MTKKISAVLLVAAAVLGLVAEPVGAEEQQRSKASKAGTVVKWTLIGAAAGTGIGFALGFRAFDDAAYAEKKIGQAGAVGGAVGGVVGFGIGRWRANSGHASPSSAPSLWRPDAPMKVRPVLRTPGSYDLGRRAIQTRTAASAASSVTTVPSGGI